MQASLLRLAERSEAAGLERIGQPHVKHLRAKRWEIAVWRTGRHRPGYLRHSHRPAGDRVARLVKKTQKTPRAALEWAERRAKEIEP